jgi:hypothetical protein
MKKIALALFALALVIPSVAIAGDDNLRVLTHFVEDVGGEDGWEMAGWMIAPNITSAPEKWVALAGPRYQQDDWWVEVMGGAVVNDDKATPLFDVRASYERFKPFTLWTNWQWIDPGAGSGQALYAYVQGDYWVVPKRLALGLETENTFKDGGEDAVSWGPHLIVPVGKLTLVGAYQFHQTGDDQFWLRAVLSF